MAGGERIPGTPRYRHHHLKNPGTEPFLPNFLLKEWIVGCVFLLAFVLWVGFNPVDLGPKADPTDTTFIPMPDWYFLFLYQVLKYFPGNFEVFGTVLMPAVGALLLVFAPWLDVSEERHPYKRPVATISMILVTLLTFWLTNEAAVQHQAEVSGATGGSQLSAGLVKLPTIPASQIHLVDTTMPGYKVFESTCASCHGSSAQGAFGPAIYAIGKYWTQPKILAFVTKGMGQMPAKGGLSSDAQLKEVVAWLSNQKG
jgi:menaquinol-cytochrome c reductase cytochrome b/c subunit